MKQRVPIKKYSLMFSEKKIEDSFEQFFYSNNRLKEKAYK